MEDLGADSIVVLSHGTEYAGTISTGSAFTSGQLYGSGFNSSLFASAPSCAEKLSSF
jgi:hypothetical protein